MNPNQFKSVYRGLAGQCCCECSGVHIPDTDRPRFLRAVKRIETLAKAGNRVHDGGDHIVIIDARGVYQYVGYLKSNHDEANISP